MTERVSVLGAGQWGTTLADRIARGGRFVRLWTRSEPQCAELNAHRTNGAYTGDHRISERIEATTALAVALSSDVIVWALPAAAARSVATEAGPHARPSQLCIVATKGLEPGTRERVTEVIRDETCIRQLGALAGPNIALEVLRGLPAGTVCASPFPRVIDACRRLVESHTFRVFGSDDVAGVEYAGALKNVVAIAAGIADGLSLGENALGLLAWRGSHEALRLGTALGGRPDTFAGLAGFGDLMVTCQSRVSRNHRLGVALAHGGPLDRALASLGMVAEGVETARAAAVLSRRTGMVLPLFDEVRRVVEGESTPAQALDRLMALPTDGPRRP